MSRGIIVSMVLAGLCAACQSPGIQISKPPPPGSSQQNDPHITQAWDVFGSANVINHFGILCAGRVALKQGSATVSDSCFTGDSNIVLCTETSATNPVRCKPGKGVLTIEGTGSDEINYARVK